MHLLDKKTEIATEKLNLFPIQGKNIELSFSGDRIRSDVSILNGIHTSTHIAKTSIKR